VRYSVTQFIHRFFEEFDSELISARYAAKHNLSQEEVLADWEKHGKVASLAGTIIHSYLENAKRGKTLDIDYSAAIKEGVYDEVKERVNLLLPQAQEFHEDTLNKLFPIQLEYTVGIGNIIAGNIDMLCWNEKAQEFQIWDYKNLKKFTTSNLFGKVGKGAFNWFADCHLVKYSIQLTMYKLILERVLGIRIGKCYLVHFNYEKDGDEFDIYPCLDVVKQCNIELDNLIQSHKALRQSEE
jgi:ATP-dependent exoDNAse (exonuclease V) beta subunit